MKAKVLETGEIIECEWYETSHTAGEVYVEYVNNDQKFYFGDELEILEKDDNGLVTIPKELYEHLIWCKEELERISDEKKVK